MLARRNWVLRLSIVINVMVLLYVGSHLVTRNGALDLIEDLQTSSRNFASLEVSQDIIISDTAPPQTQDASRHLLLQDLGPPSPATHNTTPLGTTPGPLASRSTVGTAEGLRSTTETSSKPAVEATAPTLQDIIRCRDRDPVQRFAMRGDYWVLYNYVLAGRQFRCWESVTYTTHADFTFLDNLVPLLDRWQGPISLALHAPGMDFVETMRTIQYLRECASPLVAQLVTFHIYFHSHHVPTRIPHNGKLYPPGPFNCSAPAPWVNLAANHTYKAQKKLIYPVNVGRNVARESALTHYVLASDIELYPSPHVVPDFLEMIHRQDPPLLRKNPKVFPLQLFELEANMRLPADKTELVGMLKNRSAIPFHKKVCAGCHTVPHSKEWLALVPRPGLHVFDIGKRLGHFVQWEPIFIGTHSDPLYDERLSWEGKRDKMTQGYVLCVLNYEFQILDNAFMTHRPGIKTLSKDGARASQMYKTNNLIRKVIFPELKALYGSRPGCKV